MFDFIDDIKLKIRQDRERRNLQKSKEAEFKVLEDKKKYETTKKTLDRDIKLEIRKAKIRKQQAISPQKAGDKAQQPEKKSAFASFQDFATDFAQRQSQGPSAVGSLNMGFGQPLEKHKPKKKRKKNEYNNSNESGTNSLLEPTIKL